MEWLGSQNLLFYSLNFDLKKLASRPFSYWDFRETGPRSLPHSVAIEAVIR